MSTLASAARGVAANPNHNSTASPRTPRVRDLMASSLARLDTRDALQSCNGRTLRAASAARRKRVPGGPMRNSRIYRLPPASLRRCFVARLSALPPHAFYVMALGGIGAPFLAAEFGFDDAAIAGLAGWISVGAFGTAIFTRLADRYGRRRGPRV